MTTTTVSTEVAKRETPSPRALVASYRDEWAAVLPTHLRADTWIAVAQGALKKGKRNADGITELEIAANNNPAAFVVALRDAARLGLEPGTEEYYLTCRKVMGRNEILGIVGYQGYIELMYRAGAVASIVAEVVFDRDQFQYRPGRDEQPLHEIDWDADDRGELRLVYAYARMRSGATSKVIVLNRTAIDRIKRSSQGANGEYSPWKLHPESMWLKSAIRQLKKWVPTSEEYRQALESVESRELAGELADFAPALPGPAQHGDAWVEDDAIDAELVDEQPPTAEPAARPVPGTDAASITDQLTACGRTDRTAIRSTLSTITGRPVASVAALTAAEAIAVAGELAACVAADDPTDALDMLLVDIKRGDAEQAEAAVQA